MERGALALHLLKPLARENAQPSEDYVCTISKPGTTSKTNGLLHIKKSDFKKKGSTFRHNACKNGFLIKERFVYIEFELANKLINDKYF